MGRNSFARSALLTVSLLTLSAAAVPPIVPRAVALAGHAVARVVDNANGTVALATAVSPTEFLSAAARVEAAGTVRLVLRAGETLAVTAQRRDEASGLTLLTVAHAQPRSVSFGASERPLSGRRLYAPLVTDPRMTWRIGWSWSERGDWLRTDHDPAALHPGAPLFTADGRLVGLALFAAEPGEPLTEDGDLLLVGPTGPMTLAVSVEGLHAALARLRSSIP